MTRTTVIPTSRESGPIPRASNPSREAHPPRASSRIAALTEGVRRCHFAASPRSPGSFQPVYGTSWLDSPQLESDKRLSAGRDAGACPAAISFRGDTLPCTTWALKPGEMTIECPLRPIPSPPADSGWATDSPSEALRDGPPIDTNRSRRPRDSREGGPVGAGNRERWVPTMGKPKRPAVPEGVGRTFEDLLRSIRGIDAELAARPGVPSTSA
jgi:hypothetical protein